MKKQTKHIVKELYLLTRQRPIASMTAPTHAATMIMMATDAAATMHHAFKTASKDTQRPSVGFTLSSIIIINIIIIIIIIVIMYTYYGAAQLSSVLR